MLNLKSATSAIVALAALATLASAATIVVPNTAETGGISTVFRQLPRAYQSYIDESQLTGLTSPVNITGIQFRIFAGAGNGVTTPTWPTSDINFSNFTLQFSQGSSAIVAAGEIPAATTTFAANQGGTVTTVRTGALTIPANSFQAGTGPTPNTFGATINFTTPYLYTPGQTLLYTLAQTGFGTANEQPFFASTDYANNLADAVSSTTATGLPADFLTLPGGFTSPYIVQLTYSAVPEPTSLALLSLGGLSLLRRRR